MVRRFELFEEMIQIKARDLLMADNLRVDWKPISTAPYAGDLELAVIEKDGPHAVAFPCGRVVGGWIAAETKRWIKVRPTHWRVWSSPVKSRLPA